MKALYSINGLTSIRGLGQGQYGISISLDGEVVKQILKNKIKREENSPLYQAMIKEINNKYGYIKFIEDTWLLRIIQLEPNQCACFGIEGTRLSTLDNGDDLTWTSHNIDSPEQALKLTSIWLLWFNHIACLEYNKKTIVTFPRFF